MTVSQLPIEEKIIQAVCEMYEVTKEQLTTTRSTRGISRTVEIARQVASYLLYMHTNRSYRSISSILGYKDRSSAYDNRFLIIKVLSVDKDLKQKVKELEDKILEDEPEQQHHSA